MGLFSALFGKKTEPAPVVEYPTFDVADLQIKTIMKFKDPNDDYRLGKKGLSELCVPEDKIYQYFFNLSPEIVKVDNEIRFIDVYDNGDDAYLGRVADEDYEQISIWLDSDMIDRILFDVTGGKYKVLHETFIRKTMDYTYDVEKGEEDYSAKIIVHLKEVSQDGNR